MGLTSPPPIWTMSTNILFFLFDVTLNNFSEAMKAEFTSKQCKDLWSRIKESLKKNHDSGLTKLKKNYSKTDENDFVVIDGDDRTTRFRGQTERG